MWHEITNHDNGIYNMKIKPTNRSLWKQTNSSKW